MDDIWVSIVCKDLRAATIDLKVRQKISRQLLAENLHETIKGVYIQSRLDLKPEDPGIFAGTNVWWSGGRFATTMILPENVIGDFKFQHNFTHLPINMKMSMCFGLMTSFFDRALDLNKIEMKQYKRLCLALECASLSHYRKGAAHKMVAANTNLKDLVNGAEK